MDVNIDLWMLDCPNRKYYIIYFLYSNREEFLE